jgi:hypothetical protein
MENIVRSQLAIINKRGVKVYHIRVARRWGVEIGACSRPGRAMFKDRRGE